MTKSSRTRKAKARARKVAGKTGKVNANPLSTCAIETIEENESKLALTATDKRYLIGFAVLSLLITAVYWWLGGRNLFVFPAIFCLSVGARKYWSGQVRRYADKG